MNTDQSSLATIEKISAVSVYTDGKMPDLLTAIEKEVKSFIPVINTTQGRNDIKSLAHKVARSKTFLDNLGKDLVEESKKTVDAVNAVRKNMRERMDELKATARKPLTDYEDAEKEKAEKISEYIKTLTSFSDEKDEYMAYYSSGYLKANLNRLKSVVIDDRFGDRANEAAKIKDREVQKLETLIAAKVKSELEQAELEQLREEKEQREEEDRIEKIRLEGVEREKTRALKVAEEKEREKEKEIQAIKDKVEADRLKEIRLREEKEREKEKEIQAIKDKAEKDRLEEIKQREEKEREKQEEIQAIKDKAEKARLDEIKLREEKVKKQLDEDLRLKAIETARQEDEDHRRKINQNIISALSELGIMPDTGKALIIEILAGHIPNVSITY